MNYQIFDQFYSNAKKLRATFDRKFENPLRSHTERFVWDYWHVPGEYTLLRTPAHAYFSKSTYDAFHRYLVRWGRLHLGCHDVSPPWLSCYIEGCRQERHRDVPHGPLAFVFSLSPRTGFKGGETFLGSQKTKIAPKFNRLIVFNPAIPHGVTKVSGTHDPRHGRLVVHGWFVNPRPFWVGPLNVDDVREGLDGLSNVLNPKWRLGQGLLSLRLSIAKSGKVTRVGPLANTLLKADPKSVAALTAGLRELRFPNKSSTTFLTLPLLMG